METFRVKLRMRYTRISCMPFGATLELDRVVLALSERDALHQACHCVDRDLEELFWNINTMNVTAVHLEVQAISRCAPAAVEPWNPEPFAPDLPLPRHVVIKSP